MRILVVGAGVIGSYLIHAACTAGNDVTVVARGAWGETLRERGLVIRHWVQHTTTTDRPRVVTSVPEDEHFDAAFSVMRQDQQLAALPQLARIDTEVLVLVGNDLRAREVEERLVAKGRAGRVLFGFQSTAGNREGDHVVCVRWGASGLDVGPLRGEPSEHDKALLGRVFSGAYKPRWTHDFGDWLTCHATAVLPMCFASYACDCDLHKASGELLDLLVEAQREGYALISELGCQILPESDQGLLDGGPRTALWRGFMWLLAHTAIGTLCCDDHCKHAPDEMRSLDRDFERMRGHRPDFSMPAWDELLARMGGWDDVLSRWG